MPYLLAQMGSDEPDLLIALIFFAVMLTGVIGAFAMVSLTIIGFVFRSRPAFKAALITAGGVAGALLCLWWLEPWVSGQNRHDQPTESPLAPVRFWTAAWGLVVATSCLGLWRGGSLVSPPRELTVPWLLTWSAVYLVIGHALAGMLGVAVVSMIAALLIFGRIESQRSAGKGPIHQAWDSEL